jgi:hypothetical protein
MMAVVVTAMDGPNVLFLIAGKGFGSGFGENWR